MIFGKWQVAEQSAAYLTASATDGAWTCARLRLSVSEQRPRHARNLPEALLHSAWRAAGGSAAAIKGRDGHSYSVIYPGRPADGAGPDFRDAVLLRDDGRRVHGHVEVHVRSSDWHGHGHTDDPAYNGVVLHVVAEDAGAPIATPSGMRIPLLVLDRRSIRKLVSTDGWTGAASRAAPLPTLDMAAAGDEWFMNRAHGYSLQLEDDPEQAMWEGALECLGYPANKKGFRQLAARLPWRTVYEYAGSCNRTNLEDLLAWAAGFRPKPSSVHPALILQGKPPEWRARAGRPANHPRVRIRAAAAWAGRWVRFGSLVEMFAETVRLAEKPGELAEPFIVTASTGRTSPLGLSRAREIVVNHMLPAVYAFATRNGNTRLAGQAREMFRKHPLLSTNGITREASRLLQARGVNGKPRTACEQQGLLHIYRMTVAAQRSDSQLPLL